jgi:heat shock protein 4
MFFTKLKEITEAWCQGEVVDAVVAVPAYFSDIHRKALLDAAHIAGLNVLRVLNEHAAVALGYGIYRTEQFDAEKPMTVAFCTMGHVVFSVSVVHFTRGKLTVLCEKSDKVGGRDMDECLMRVFAGRFKKKSGCDPLSSQKPQFKLEDAVTKTKKILSANSEASISVECLMEDEDFQSSITRDEFLEMCKPMMEKVNGVLEAAIAQCGLPVTDIDAVEMCGGASRVPWVKEMCSKAFGGKDLSTTMNADECVARGCAVQAGILSKVYKVRDFKVEDISPFPVSLSYLGPQINGEAPAQKAGVVFPAKSAMHLMKLVTFQRKEPFELTLKYADVKALVPGTPEEIARYVVEVPKHVDLKKVKVKALLSLHGTFEITGAQLFEEELGEENSPPAGDAAQSEEAVTATGADATKPDKRKDVSEIGPALKPRKRYKRTELSVRTATQLGLTAEQLEQGRSKEEAIKAEMREIDALGALRNDLESYILTMKNGLREKYEPFANPSDKEELQKTFDKAEEWLWDHVDEGKQAVIDKSAEMKKLGDPILHRFREHCGRANLMQSLRTATLRSNEKASPSQRPVDPTQLFDLECARSDATSWLAAKEAEQAKLARHEDPVLLCAELESRIEAISKLATVCEPDENIVEVVPVRSPSATETMEVD